MRRFTSNAQFCCEEHQEQYKKETVSRLLEYREPAAAHAAEDPIHRLGLMHSDAQGTHDEWKLQSFILPELRRFAPARAPLSGLIGMIMAPRIQWAAGLHALKLWPGVAAAKPTSAATAPAPAAVRPELAEAVWIDPALLDRGANLRRWIETASAIQSKPSGTTGVLVETCRPLAWGAGRHGALGGVRAVEHFAPVTASAIATAPSGAIQGSLQVVQTSAHVLAAAFQNLEFAPLKKATAPLFSLSAVPRNPETLERFAKDCGLWPERSDRAPRLPLGPGARQLRNEPRSPQASIRITPSAEPLTLPLLWPAIHESAGAAGIPHIAQHYTPGDELIRLESALIPAAAQGALAVSLIPDECAPAVPQASALRFSTEPATVADTIHEPARRFATPAGIRAEMVTHPGVSSSPKIADGPAAPFGPPGHAAPSRPPLLPKSSLTPHKVSTTPRPVRVERPPALNPGDLAGWVMALPLRSITEGHPIHEETPPVSPPPSMAHLPVRSAAQVLSSRRLATMAMLTAAELNVSIPAATALRAADPMEAKRVAPAPVPAFLILSPPAGRPASVFASAPIELQAGRPPVAGMLNVAPAAYAPAGRPAAAPPPAPMKVGRQTPRPAAPPLPEPERPVRRPVIPIAPVIPPATLAEEGGVREALEKMHRRRRSGSVRRLLQDVSFAWHERLRPALGSKRARAAMATVVALLLTALIARLAGSSVAAKSLAQPIEDRSFYLTEDSFHSDLRAWSNPAAFVKREDGLVEVKDGVTLFQPSMKRADYEFTFSGRAYHSSLGWVVRAVDAKNFYAFKLARIGKGKERRSVLLRYPVADGAEAEKPQMVALPFELDETRMYQVLVRAAGNRVTTVVDDRGVDSYADPRLKAGGVGFLAADGESSLIQSAGISGNDDGMGRTIYWLTGFCQFVSSKF